MNRRDFMQSSAVAIAGLSLPFRDLSQTDPVRAAVSGTGGRGTALLRKLLTVDGCEVVAVCDNYEPHLQKARKTAGEGVAAYESYQKLLKKVKPDAVLIGVPLYLHHEVAMAAIESGADVFCEKTMCYSIEQAEQLAGKVREAGTIFQVGLQRHANPIYRQAAAMIQSGMLGQIISAKCQWHRNNDWRRPVPVEKGHPDWQRLEHHLNWRLYRQYSRGLMTELGSHQLDVVNWMFGTTPSRAMGMAGTDYWRDGREVFDNVFCLYEYSLANESGEAYTARVSYTSIQGNAYEGASELIMGTKGTLYLSSGKGLFYKEAGVEDVGWTKDKDQNAAVVTAGKTLKLSNSPWAHRSRPMELDSYSDDTREQLISFLDNVQRRDPNTICDVEDGLKDTITTLIGHQAMSEGRIVAFPG
ncbi:MAG: Gfo/Idh/MocA family oxidoreductase [Bacteroidota bacterium]